MVRRLDWFKDTGFMQLAVRTEHIDGTLTVLSPISSPWEWWQGTWCRMEEDHWLRLAPLNKANLSPLLLWGSGQCRSRSAEALPACVHTHTHSHTPKREQQEMRSARTLVFPLGSEKKDGHTTWISVSPTHPKVLEHQEDDIQTRNILMHFSDPASWF